MAGAGVLVSLLLGITTDTDKIDIVALVDLLVIVYVTIGGMKGATGVQMVKACLTVRLLPLMSSDMLRTACQGGA